MKLSKRAVLDLYTDYLISSCGLATATGMSAVLDHQISHDNITRLLSSNYYYIAQSLERGKANMPGNRTRRCCFNYFLSDDFLLLCGMDSYVLNTKAMQADLYLCI